MNKFFLVFIFFVSITEVANAIRVDSWLKSGLFGTLTIAGAVGVVGFSKVFLSFDRNKEEDEANILWAELTQKGARIWKDSIEGSAYTWNNGTLTTTTHTSWKIEFPQGNFSAQELAMMEWQWNRLKSIKNEDFIKNLSICFGLSLFLASCGAWGIYNQVIF